MRGIVSYGAYVLDDVKSPVDLQGAVERAEQLIAESEYGP